MPARRARQRGSGLDFSNPDRWPACRSRVVPTTCSTSSARRFATAFGRRVGAGAPRDAGSGGEVQHPRGVAGARPGAGQRPAWPSTTPPSERSRSSARRSACSAERASATRRRRHGSGVGRSGGHRVIDMSSFWAGPLAARLLAELGADVIKVEPPGGEGAYQLMPVLPNIYVDAQPVEARAHPRPATATKIVIGCSISSRPPMSSSRTRSPARGSGWGSTRTTCAPSIPGLVYARAKGFGLCGPLASRPAFDYVVQAATGMEMTQGGGQPATGELHGQRLLAPGSTSLPASCSRCSAAHAVRRSPSSRPR